MICRWTADAGFLSSAGDATRVVRCLGLVLCLALVAGLAGCGASNGGSNGHSDYKKTVDDATGLLFSYPYNGQQDVALGSQIVLRAGAAFEGSANNAFKLETGDGRSTQDVDISISHDDNQPGIYRIDTDRPLRGDTTYRVTAARALTAHNTRFDAGQTLFQFTTGPTPGLPSAGAFHVTSAAPGNTNPVTGQRRIFAQFDTVHVSLSEAVDPATVVDGRSFRFTNGDGQEISGALTVSGNEISFDPKHDLAPGTYTLSLSNDVKSAFGKNLKSYTTQRTVLNTGHIVQQNLVVDNDQGFSGDTDNSPLNGLPDNLVTLETQLIGTNKQAARTDPMRQGILSNLAQPGMPGFGDVLPVSIPAGQNFQLQPLSVRLNGDIPTPVQSGPIQVQFASNANIYLMANNYRSIKTPTAVRLRFDLNDTTRISASPGTSGYVVQALANGVFNQSALNVQASGLAIPQKNGDLLISAVGTFPLTVARSDGLTVNFALTFRLPAGDQTPVQPDTTAPFATAQVPSACFQVAGTPAYDATFSQVRTSPIALPEQQCVGVLQAGGAARTASGIDSAALDGDIALTFSEPLDPSTVNSQSIQLTGGGNSVPLTFTTDGSTITIHPGQALQPDTQYTVTLDNGAQLTDLAGNALQSVGNGGSGQTIRFTTEPMVNTDPAPALLGQLSPGLACAVTGGNFASGGDVTGHCVGDAPQSGGARNYPVATSPRNVPINAYFSKPVQKNSIVLANGCLTGGSGDGNTNGNATVALERVDGNGQCLGAAPARLAFADADSATTEGFSIRPVGELADNQRYWVVICGTRRTTPATSCSAQITDINGLALNTDPLNGTAATRTRTASDVAGGPDLIVPFETTSFSSDYYADQFALPATDTNGNGQVDNGEHPEPPNQILAQLTLGGMALGNSSRQDGLYPAYVALNRPIAIRKTQTDCSALQNVTDSNGNSVIGDSPSACIPVSLLPGGINDLTAINITAGATMQVLPTLITNTLRSLVNNPQSGVTMSTPLGALTGVLGDGVGAPQVASITVGQVLGDTSGQTAAALASGLLDGASGDDVIASTGRLLLRYPDEAGNGGDATPQTGYIVPECKGMLDGDGYDYAPCFVAHLTLIANAPDSSNLALPQQPVIANLVGPVTFEQNGRLVIPLQNANQIRLQGTALGLLPSTATIPPGDLHLQLAGNAAHGGVAFPQR